MDVKWFKKRQKELGVTAEDIAAEMGRARSGVSHIYSGHQRMSLAWANAFAKVLQVPVQEVLRRAGVAAAQDGPARPVPGFGESDVARLEAEGGAGARNRQIAELLGGGRPGVDVWTVTSHALAMRGYLPGDAILVDTNQSEQCRAGDIVVAQIYDWQHAAAHTVLRQFEPPVLISATTDPDTRVARVVDNSNVVIKGRVLACWRTPRRTAGDGHD